MGKASRTKQDPDRRAKIAAQRAAEKRRQQRNRILMAGGAIVVVLIVVVTFVLVANNKKNSPAATANGPTGAALASVVNQVTSVPAATLDQVGDGGGVVGQGKSPLIKLKDAAPLTSGGKPEMLYMGAEYCPYCAAERWPMVVALSRFGTFTGLKTTHSSSTDQNPNTPTFTFADAKFTSTYLTFSSVEMESNVPAGGGGYKPLQKPTADQQAILDKYDAAPYVQSQYAGSIPFIDFGNQYMISGASYDGSGLVGKTWAQVAASLKNPSDPAAKSIDATANYITAAICKMTGNQPATACTPAVKALEGKL